MRAGPTARGQGGKPRCSSSVATKATRPLTARWARYHEESDAEQHYKRRQRVWASDAAGRNQSGPAVVHRGRPSRDANGDAAGRHNVTPREDYRTALLSDSPDTGCSLSLPRRRVGLRNEPAASAPAVLRRTGGGRGVSPLRIEAVHCGVRVGAGTRTRARRPSGRGPEAPTPNLPIGSARQRMHKQQKQTNVVFSRAPSPENLPRHHFEISTKFRRRDQIRGYLRQEGTYRGLYQRKKPPAEPAA